MAANGYFQVVAEDGRMWLKIFAPEEGEVDISPEMVMKYLDAISFPDYDQVALDQYLKRKEFDSMFMLYEGEIIPESEKCIVPSRQMESVHLRDFIRRLQGAQA